MGCFNMSCGISGLSILGGDPVRYMWLVDSPYPEEDTLPNYNLRTYPLRARYDEYGGVEDVQEGPQRDVWMDVLNRDIVETGWGHNPIHDVPTQQNMEFYDAVEAVSKGRLYVDFHKAIYPFDLTREYARKLDRQLAELGIEVKTLPQEDPQPELEDPKGVPSYKVLNKALQAVAPDESFIIRELTTGAVTVSRPDWISDSDLGPIAEVLAKDYVVAEISESVGSRYGAKLLVVAKPGVAVPSVQEPRKQKVHHLMVREDVWQGCARWGKKLFKEPPYSVGRLSHSTGPEVHQDYLKYIKEISGDEEKEFRSVHNELCYVLAFLSTSPIELSPSKHSGQDSWFKEHGKFYRVMADIAKKAHKAEENGRMAE